MAVKDAFVKKNDDIDEKDIWKISPWQEKDYGAGKGVTISNVEEQDQLSLEDYLDGDNNAEVGESLLSQLGQLKTQNGIYKGYENIKTAISGGGEIESVNLTDKQDELGIKLRKIKNNKLKRVKLSSKFGLYNTYMNLLGNAAGLYVGNLGKNAYSQMADYALNKTRMSDFTLGLGVDSLVRIAKAIKNNEDGKFSSVDIPAKDLVDLNLANFFTIYTSKPGLTIRPTNNLLQYVAGKEGTLEDGLIEKGKSLAKPVANFFNFSFKVGDKDYYSDKQLLTLKQKDFIKENFPFLEYNDKNSTSTELEAEKFSLPEIKEKGKIPTNNYYNDDKVKIRKDEIDKTVIHAAARLGKTDENKGKGIEIGSIDEFLGKAYGNNDNQAPYVELKSANSVTRYTEPYSSGGLYIEPYYGSSIESFFIPFEFNADIQEGSSKAIYTTTEFLGKFVQYKSYTKGELATLTLTTKYFAIDGTDTGNSYKFNNKKELEKIDVLYNKYYTDIWQREKSWDLITIQYTESLYRSLVLPEISKASFIRPPIIRIIPPNQPNKSDNKYSTVSDLYSYPKYNKNNQNNEQNFEITRVFDSNNDNNAKRYLASDVQISPISEDSWGNNFAFDAGGNCMRKGFKVTLTLFETTKNFLDTIPSFASYVGSKKLSENVFSNERTNIIITDSEIALESNKDYKTYYTFDIKNENIKTEKANITSSETKKDSMKNHEENAETPLVDKENKDLEEQKEEINEQ